MKYDVGIPVKNEVNTLEATIYSLLEQTSAPEKIFVCINGSTDGSFELSKEISRKESKVQVITSMPGKPNAWNKIVEKSDLNMLMMVDGDVLINKDAAHNISSTFDKESHLYIVSGSFMYLEPKEKTLFSYFSVDSWNKVVPIEFLTGSLYMVKINEMRSLAKALNVDFMPQNIINDDGFLETNINKKICLFS